MDRVIYSQDNLGVFALSSSLNLMDVDLIISNYFCPLRSHSAAMSSSLDIDSSLTEEQLF